MQLRPRAHYVDNPRHGHPDPRGFGVVFAPVPLEGAEAAGTIPL